ncbi:UDP-N-acetylmuramoyl-tripeptide--D-alanyl-D-alanine ligase [Apibacter mensalis]|uniref:Alanine racemase n=1 Tax=Apibacter mensalis TaxID=1586267 RepID=A0A0X3ASE6_9FLAO|nr:bifunctional UDP-N-acetylmuramoyl-tripeptide:D-alanyl-D-alanine ligase/alanine racemase [Apibacter mensalis]CVK17005.1 UDP-N-acetylmuramoyl-tripeptide--D-alanyl-D-alanine ligase [Apibacter mensalis]
MIYCVTHLALIIDAQLIGDPDRKIQHIFYDSRNIVSPADGAFIAFIGIRDGHKYMEDAYKKSVRIFIGSHIPVIHSDATYLIVDDPVSALQKWACYHINSYPSLTTIGITGSNGKTILKEWLNQCLWDVFSIIKSPKSFNSQMGLPLSVLQIESKHDLGIFEVGISKPGEMDKQERVLHPTIGVLTNVLGAHSEYFKDKEEQIVEKIKLFKNSQVIIYPTDPNISKIIQLEYPNKKLISFGKENSDIQLLETTLNGNTTVLSVSVFGEPREFIFPFTDDASIQNVLCLLAVLSELGYNYDFIQEKILHLQFVSMRLELVSGINNCTIINDTFNSDYQSLEIALHFLFQQNKPKKVLVLSDILQSRLAEAELYKKIADLVNSFPLHHILLVGEKTYKYRHLFNNILKSFLSTVEVIRFLESRSIKDAALLIKGARKFELEKVTQLLEVQSHDTILEVNLHSLLMNVNYFKSLLKPETKIIAMVKASSYGLGNFEIAEVLQFYHIDYLAVAYPDEGFKLRDKGIHLPIMVMNPEISSYDRVIEYELEPEIYSFRELNLFVHKLKEKKLTKYPIHIKIDTGMHRLGFQPEEAQKLGDLLKNNVYVKVKSIFSHFAVSDVSEQEEFTRLQASKLKYSFDILAKILGYQPLLHIANSAGIINYPEYHFDAVRLGIGMYGYIDNEKTLKKLKNVITLKTVISNIHDLEPGETVGYGRQFVAKKTTSVATLPIGYADGIRRIVGNGKGYVTIHGKKAPIIGNICMDMMMIDVTNIACKEGDTVIIMGENPSLIEYAEWYQTIPYEVLTSISSRVKRIYYRE